MIPMIMRVDFGNSYRLNQMLSFFLMALWAYDQLYTLPVNILVKNRSYHFKVKSAVCFLSSASSS